MSTQNAIMTLQYHNDVINVLICAAEEPNGRNDVELRDGDLRYCILIGPILLTDNNTIDFTRAEGQGVSFAGDSDELE